MEGFGGLFGDPEELSKRMAEFAEQMQAQQGLVWADNAIKLAVMATVFPDAVTLVREARSGLQ